MKKFSDYLTEEEIIKLEEELELLSEDVDNTIASSLKFTIDKVLDISNDINALKGISEILKEFRKFTTIKPTSKSIDIYMSYRIKLSGMISDMIKVCDKILMKVSIKEIVDIQSLMKRLLSTIQHLVRVNHPSYDGGISRKEAKQRAKDRAENEDKTVKRLTVDRHTLPTSSSKRR